MKSELIVVRFTFFFFRGDYPWMNGLEIEIDNPLVPMELMPVKPLDYYNYDFLDPNWKPKSFWGRLLGRK